MTTEKKTEKDFLKSGRRRCRKTALSARTAGALVAALVLAVGPVPAVCSGNMALTASAASGTEKVTLRIANWEEYIDEGGWDEEEAIDLDDENSTVILGENSMIEDFEDWYL